MKQRRRQQERLGPGTYRIRSFLEETRPCSLRGVCDTREQRFRERRKDCFPGPGAYGPRGDPYAPLEERDRRSAGTRGLLDSGTGKRPPPAATGSGLGPGAYELPSGIGQRLRRAGGPGPGQPFPGHRAKPAGGGRHASEKRGTELSTGTVKGFVDELMSKENKKKGCFSTLPRNPGCPTQRIFWATLSQCPRQACALGPGSYDPKPAERSVFSSQPPFCSSAKRFDRKSHRLFTGNENPVGVGRYSIAEREQRPRLMQYRSLYRRDAQRYLSDLGRDACLLERLKPVAKNNWRHSVSAPRGPATSEEITIFQP